MGGVLSSTYVFLKLVFCMIKVEPGGLVGVAWADVGVDFFFRGGGLY